MRLHSWKANAKMSFYFTGLVQRPGTVNQSMLFLKASSELFETCLVCKKFWGQARADGHLPFNLQCRNCNYAKWWQSQSIVGSTPVGNLLPSAAMYFNSTLFFQVAKVLILDFTPSVCSVGLHFILWLGLQHVELWFRMTLRRIAILCTHQQNNEVGGSYHMEKEGLKRSLDVLEHNGWMWTT